MSSGLLLDPSLDPCNLIPVFQALTGDWETITDATIVPHVRAQLILRRFSVPDQCAEAGRYYALYHLKFTWKALCLNLYRARETEALQIARPYIQTVTGIYACTIDMVCNAYQNNCSPISDCPVISILG